MSSFRRLAAAAVLLAAAPALRAQQLPTPDQARRVLESRPDLAAQLRQEISGSGLTPDQIRARLRASGYPEDLLDTYLRAPRSARDSVAGGLPSDDVLDAVAALGLADSTDTLAGRDSLRSALRRRRLARDPRDANRLDSLVDARDSLADDTLPRLTPARRRPGARTVVDSGMAIFGLNVFAGATTQFDPNLAGPVDANYRLGPGDRLVLLITGDTERAFTLDVTREGFVVIPGVGELPVANLTLAQLDDVLYQRLGRLYSGLRRGPGATTRFSINVARLHTNQIYVLGDVAEPGSYRVSSAGTALTALYAAGGPTENGSLRRVEVRRGGRIVDTLDLYDYLLRADGSHDPRLQSGDVVFVPVHGARVRVHGEIVRPATYELRPGETMADVMRAAGGFTAAAVRRRVQVSRILPPNERAGGDAGRVVIDVASVGTRDSGLGTREGAVPESRVPSPESRVPAFPLEDGDVLRVFPVSDRVARRVTVKGDVWSPGMVGFTPGMKLADAVRMAGGLKPDAYLGQVLVSRLRPADSSRVQLRTAFKDASGATSEDVVLQDDDEVRVFAVGDMRPATFVAITGAVRRPGRYAYREGMTLRDLVLVAGGLDRRAYLGEAEIATPPADGSARLAVARRVPLDSTYLLVADRGAQNDGQAGPRAAPEVALEPYANVLVFAQPDGAAERARRVTLTGEVRFPGTYTLLAKDERLSDLLQRAGGPTKTAYAGGIVFYRAHGNVGRIGVDLPSVLRDAHYRDNLLLQDGDSVHLPAYSGVVEVQGAVNAPRAVAWVPGKSLDYYVRAAGGTTRTGEMRRAYVTQPDGAVESAVARRMMPDVVPTPKPGSVVYVTERDPADHSVESVQKLAVLAQILGALTTIAVVLRR
ncbi:polysaccharide export protein [Gemmatirosa kalamazoonensis]|uniref:Polysaccharide export protein n=1 Tax=Gemmatirosa kalamazoonensis TaxID=861299 RepID=W0RDK0_9BACT|nr:SLBB domain-containing protein [Gemmatirosa kalamazoonensis]AHG88395.1 polysaccharide export protein [Gemmatirosa kalamazoonensis]